MKCTISRDVWLHAASWTVAPSQLDGPPGISSPKGLKTLLSERQVTKNDVKNAVHESDISRIEKIKNETERRAASESWINCRIPAARNGRNQIVIRLRREKQIVAIEPRGD